MQVLSALWALINCFFGYALFRALIVLHALGAGILLGRGLVHAYVASPSAMDAFMAAAVAGILLALLAWFFWRLAFAVAVFAPVLYGVLIALGTGAGGWFLGVLVALAVAVLAYLLVREMVILVTALFGGFATVFSIASLIAGGAEPLARTLSGSFWLSAGLICLSLTLSTIGGVVQLRLARRMRSSLSPSGQRAGRRGSSSIGPRFTRV